MTAKKSVSMKVKAKVRKFRVSVDQTVWNFTEKNEALEKALKLIALAPMAVTFIQFDE